MLTARRLILSFLFLIFLIFIPSSALAQSNYIPTPANPSPDNVTTQNAYATPNTNPDVPKNLHTWTQTVMIEVMSTMICQLSGVDPINPKQGCLGIDSVTNKIGFLKPQENDGSQPKIGGAIGFMNNMIVTLYNPPLHTSDYFNYLSQNFGVVKKTYAQGLGFSGLNPLMGLWTAMRNVVYLFFVVVFVVIGLALMLRIKIDARTVMTIENQIPKIIIGLVLVTFSFAIAGFLIDLMYVFIYLIYSIISGVPGAQVTSLDPGLMQGKTAVEAANGIAGAGGIFGITYNISGNLKTIIQSMLGISGCTDPGSCVSSMFSPLSFLGDMFSGSAGTHNVIDLVFGLISGYAGVEVFKTLATAGSLNIAGFDVGRLISWGGGFPAAGVAYAGTQYLLREILPFLIVYIIIFIAILWALLRLWFQLLTAYIFILLDVILAPFFIITGVFPGGLGIGGWLRDIVSNLSVFPVTIAMFLISKVIVDSIGNSKDGIFTPPLIGNPTPYANNPSPITSIIALGILLLTPQVVAIMKDALKAPQFKYTAAIGQAIGKGIGAVNLPSHTQKLGQFGYYTGLALREDSMFGKILGKGMSRLRGKGSS
ncbi:hypothetical protein C4559_01370 [Candidatus Microgenomates bacterium]|nr:MAG: hypothetical protein C4559_01370 [Candidatus Microgenomates bacterium]